MGEDYLRTRHSIFKTLETRNLPLRFIQRANTRLLPLYTGLTFIFSFYSTAEAQNEQQPPFETSAYIEPKDQQSNGDALVTPTALLETQCRYDASRQFVGWNTKKDQIRCQVSNARQTDWTWDFTRYKWLFTCNCQCYFFARSKRQFLLLNTCGGKSHPCR